MVTDRKKKDAAAALNTLLQCCLDAHDGYQAASRHVDDMDMKKLFGHFALERKRFGEELGLAVEALGGTPRERGSVRGALHRGWIELAGGMDEPLRGDVVKECVRGESIAVRHYEDTLAKGLPGDARRLVESQLGAITEARNRLSAIAATAASR